MSVVPHPSPPGLLSMQHGGHYGQVGGAAAPVDAHIQRQRLLAQLNESTWQRIGTHLTLEMIVPADVAF